MRKHSFAVLYNFYKDSIFQTDLKEKRMKKDFSSSKTYKPCVQHYAGNITQSLNAYTAPAAFFPHRVSHTLFLVSLFLDHLPC